MKKTAKNYDFNKLIRWIAVTFAVIVVLNFAVSFLAMYSINREVDSLADAMINENLRDMENTLDIAEQLLANEISFDTDIEKLARSRRFAAEELTWHEEYLITTRLKLTLEAWGKQQLYPVNYLIYIPDREIAIHSASDEREYMKWYKYGDSLLEFLENQTSENLYVSSHNWELYHLDGNYFTVQYHRMDNYYMMSWIWLDDISAYISSAEGSTQSHMFFLDMQGHPVNQKELLSQLQVDFPDYRVNEQRFNVFKSQISTVKEIEGAEFFAGIVVVGYQQVMRVLEIQIIIAIVLVLVGVAYLWMALYIRRSLILPIQTFSENIAQLQNDEDFNLATYYQINELGKASELLADMVGKIKGLKINIYEKTLEEQKVQTDFLSLQIEPHFYLNCLNIIYNLAELEKYQDIQKLSRSTSDYLRYIFKKHDDVVLFGDELEHIKRYLEIQKIRYRNGFEVQFHIDEAVKYAVVPPLFVQTFVENAIKHTVDWDEAIEVVLSARVEQNTRGLQYVEVIIEDSGEGFDAEILEKLQHGGDISQGEHRIGIMNAIRRLKLSYGDAASIRFYNRVPHGAGVYIRIPFERQADVMKKKSREDKQ